VYVFVCMRICTFTCVCECVCVCVCVCVGGRTGRVLGVCFDEKTGVEINEKMVKEGEAVAYVAYSKV